MATRINTATRNLMVDSLNGTLAELKVYSGSQPATADTAASGTLLVTIDITNGFNTAANGAATLVATETGTAVASGTAGWARLQDAAGTYRVDGTVGLSGSGADFIISATSISNGGTINLTNATLTMPAG